VARIACGLTDDYGRPRLGLLCGHRGSSFEQSPTALCLENGMLEQAVNGAVVAAGLSEYCSCGARATRLSHVTNARQI
jgi:hypothetical protein